MSARARGGDRELIRVLSAAVGAPVPALDEAPSYPSVRAQVERDRIEQRETELAAAAASGSAEAVEQARQRHADVDRAREILRRGRPEPTIAF